MKRHSSAAVLALAALAVLGLAGPAAAAEQVPFVGRLEATVTRTPLAPPFVAVLVQGGGTATQPGRFTFAFPHTVNTATRTATGSYQFVAANGDRLVATGSGQAMPTATPGVLAVVETMTITGGTGRFAGATGAFRVERLFNMATGRTVGAFAGTISSPGAAGR